MKNITKAKPRRFGLLLYVAGSTPRSARALVNIKEICEEHLNGCYDLERVLIGLDLKPKQ